MKILSRNHGKDCCATETRPNGTILDLVGTSNFIQKGKLLALVFCYQNCSDLLSEKNYCSDYKKLFKFEAESQEFNKLIEQLIQTLQGQTSFWLQNAFYLVPGGFSYLMN